MGSTQWYNYLGERTTYNIAGLQYRSLEVREAFKSKSSGTVILLRREPNNSHDPHAVAVYSAITLRGEPGYEYHKVGYLERHVANNEFHDLPLDHVLEATKFGAGTIQLNGKVRKYLR